MTQDAGSFSPTGADPNAESVPMFDLRRVDQRPDLPPEADLSGSRGFLVDGFSPTDVQGVVRPRRR